VLPLLPQSHGFCIYIILLGATLHVLCADSVVRCYATSASLWWIQHANIMLLPGHLPASLRRIAPGTNTVKCKWIVYVNFELQCLILLVPRLDGLWTVCTLCAGHCYWCHIYILYRLQYVYNYVVASDHYEIINSYS